MPISHSRRIAALTCAAVMAISCAPKDAVSPAVDQAAPALSLAQVHDSAIVLDSHIDLELELIADDMDPWSSGESRATLDKMKAGGMDGAFLIVYAPQGPDTQADIDAAALIAERRYQAIMRLIEKYPDDIELALTADDARRIHTAGKRIALIGIENAYPFGNSIDALSKWEQRGVRYVGLTHVGHNQFADSSNPSYSRGETDSLHGGLSPLGQELVAALNASGIIIDVSHASKATSLQAIALSKVPVMASHSGAASVTPNRRNLDDEQLEALAANGGVVQIVAYGPYLKSKTAEHLAFENRVRAELGLEDDFAFMAMNEDTEAAFDEKMSAAASLTSPANVGDLVNHIDYVVKKIGIDHVGISSDFDGGGKIEGWMDASETQNVTAELMARGYSQDDIAKIWGGNLLRVFSAAQDHANK